MKLNRFIQIIIAVLFIFSCTIKESKKDIVLVKENNSKYEIILEDIKRYDNDSVNVEMKFNKNRNELATINIRNNTKKHIILNQWSIYNSSIILEFRDMESNIIGNIPYSVPPKNIEKYDTILKSTQNLEYSIRTFSNCVKEKEKGEVFVEIGYHFENEKKYFSAESNHFYYKKQKIIK